jgi:hypothetical protein
MDGLAAHSGATQETLAAGSHESITKGSNFYPEKRARKQFATTPPVRTLQHTRPTPGNEVSYKERACSRIFAGSTGSSLILVLFGGVHWIEQTLNAFLLPVAIDEHQLAAPGCNY